MEYALRTPCASANRPKILVKPVQRLANDVVPWRNVAAINKHISFVFFRRTQQPKHGLLGSLGGKNEIVSAIDHQGRNFHPRSKADLSDFRKLFFLAETATHEYRGTKTALHCKHHGGLARSLAYAIIGKLLVIKVRPRFDVIHGAGEIFVVLDFQVSFATRPFSKLAEINRS